MPGSEAGSLAVVREGREGKKSGKQIYRQGRGRKGRIFLPAWMRSTVFLRFSGVSLRRAYARIRNVFARHREGIGSSAPISNARWN